MAGQVGVGLAVGGDVPEVAVAVHHLLGRPPADAELQPAARDQVGGAGVLRQVQGVLVPHVDDRGTDLDPVRAGADGGQQRERRAELAGEVVHPEVGAVGAELLGRHGQLDGLQQCVGRGLHPGVRRGRPVAEREESDLLHGWLNHQ
jgi:hypothetical protein